MILTGTPFGGVEEDGTETNFPNKFRTKETADHSALIIRLLKPNGRAAVVLPDGTLFGEGVKTRIKEELMEKCNLYGLGYLTKFSILSIKTILFLKKALQKTFGTLNTHIPQELRVTINQSQLISKNLI